MTGSLALDVLNLVLGKNNRDMLSHCLVIMNVLSNSTSYLDCSKVSDGFQIRRSKEGCWNLKVWAYWMATMRHAPDCWLHVETSLVMVNS